MAVIKPFQSIRPKEGLANKIAALPYDVFNRLEAKEEAEKEPLSFINIDRPETQFSENTDMYSERVYNKAAELLQTWREEGKFIQDEKKSYYLYELTMEHRSQTGLVACASIDDYQNGIIKKHENTREEKEQDRIRHVDICCAQTGPIFLAYRSVKEMKEIVIEVKQKSPTYDFISSDGVQHRVWVINEKNKVDEIEKIFDKIQQIYIADGHHRAASAVKVGLKRREKYKEYAGNEEFNYFLAVLFPDDELQILDYNRAIKDLNGLSINDFLNKIEPNFEVKKREGKQYIPEKKGTFGMYLDGEWYQLIAKKNILHENDVVKSLDVSILQEHLLNPVLGIKDPRTDNRIEFIGGIRGLKELEKRVNSDMKVAFAMYPTSIQELFAVADAGLLMPPKSTWFEPKLRSGLFIHEIEK